MRHYSLESKKKNYERYKKWKLEHSEYIKAWNHKYYEQNKEKIKARASLYSKTHRKQINKLSREWYRKNPSRERSHAAYLRRRDKSLAYSKKYQKSHKDELYESAKEWRKRNKQKWTEIRLRHYVKRRTVPSGRIEDSLRSRLYLMISNHIKSASVLNLTGCSLEFLVGYLEAKFKKGMSWENYGIHGWHIDHIKPCCKFDLSKEEEQRKCFNYTNLQPLWAKENLSKGGKYVETI